MQKYEVQFYKDHAGQVPMNLFMDRLALDLRAKVASRISLLESYGPDIIDNESDIFRLLVRYDNRRTLSVYGFRGESGLVITDGRISKNTRLPKHEIQYTLQLMENYLSQEGEPMKYRTYLNEELKDPAFKAEYRNALKSTKHVHELIELRLSLGLSQEKLAELSGLAQAEISRYETGMRSPSLATLDSIAESLNMELSLKFTKK